jgi:hypothetical protein
MISFARQGYIAFSWSMVGYNEANQIKHIVLCRSSIDGCHCERSEAISIVRYREIATA